MNYYGFLQDVGGASRVTKMRREAIENASVFPVKYDAIAETAKAWHPGKLRLVVKEIRQASPTAKTVRFVRKDGGELPYFYAGQFISLEFEIDGKTVSRPYSISSAPFEARGEGSYAEITVRRSKGDGFIADYINEKLKPGDEVTGNMGLGQFYWEPLRDSKHVVALAGGTGITPFASMAKEIAAGKLDYDLTIIFGSVSAGDIILKDELDRIKCDKVKIIHVLSGDDPSWQGERGFITADIIKKYSAEDSTYFICGPQAMYRFMREELKKLDIPARRVRFEVFGQARDITAYDGYPVEKAGETFSLTVKRGIAEDVIPARACESLVTAFERAGIKIDTACRSGECGFCRTKVLSGEYFVCPENDGRRAADKDFNYVHACSCYPLSDMTVRIPIE